MASDPTDEMYARLTAAGWSYDDRRKVWIDTGDAGATLRSLPMPDDPAPDRPPANPHTAGLSPEQKAIPASDAPRNWTEDYPHENGNYQCRCRLCGRVFFGHKRRVTCRECAPPANPPPPSGAPSRPHAGFVRWRSVGGGVFRDRDEPARTFRVVANDGETLTLEWIDGTRETQHADDMPRGWYEPVTGPAAADKAAVGSLRYLLRRTAECCDLIPAPASDCWTNGLESDVRAALASALAPGDAGAPAPDCNVRRIEGCWASRRYDALAKYLGRPDLTTSVPVAALALVRLVESGHGGHPIVRRLRQEVSAARERGGDWGNPETTNLCRRAMSLFAPAPGQPAGGPAAGSGEEPKAENP